MSTVRHDICEEPDVSASVPRPLVLMEWSLLAILVLVFALGLHRSFIANINWDEFYYLAQVHQYRDGHLSLPLQTAHVHLFGWLPLVSDNEIQQIFAARVILWLLSIASGLLIYGIAQEFCSRAAALLSVLFYFGFSNVVDHGLSFRYDPICAFLFVAALYLLLGAQKSRYHVPLSATVMAAALMVSIKSVFYLGTIGTIFLAFFLFEADRRAVAKNALIYLVVLSATFFLLYQVHSYSLASDALSDPGAYIASSGSKTILSGPVLPRINAVLNALSQNGPIWVFIFLGLVKASHGVFAGPDRKASLVLVSFAVPLLSLLFYRNAYAYFYVFLMPAVVVLGGVFADVLIARYRASGSGVLFLVLVVTVAMVVGSVVGDYIRKLPDRTVAEAEIVALVHRMFPEPVAYIDRNSMISSYPSAGFFMSTWGMEGYLARNRPVMEERIRRRQPKFLIANSCALDLSSRPADGREFCQYRLLDRDLDTLRANFVHHWGAVYVAGKAFDLPGSSDPERFEILIPGTYTLEAGAAVSIDGVTYWPGEQVYLDQAFHRIAALDAATHATLRWGVKLYKPNHEPSAQAIYDEH